MRITAVELYYVKVPLAPSRPWIWSRYPDFEPSWIPGFRQSEVRFYLLKLETDSGHEGVAAMPAMGPERTGLGPLLGTYLMDMNPLDIDLVNQRIQEFSYIGMRNGWIDAAFWDLIGKARGEPLWKLLGGTGGGIFPYASTGSTHGHDVRKAREIAQMHGDAGFRGFKLRVKSDEISPMVDYVAAAREAAGKSMSIMVDANQGWPVDIVDKTPRWTLEFAQKFAKAIEKYKIYWLEEPLNRGNLEGLAQLRKSTRTPIAGGEMNSTWRDFKAMLRLRSVDIFQPDAVLVGGTYAGGISVISWLIAEILKKGKKAGGKKSDAKSYPRFSPHTWTTGLGYVVGLHLTGVLPEESRSLLEYPLEGNWNADYWGGFIRNLPRPDDRMRIQIPDGPGLGIEIDWDVIRRFGKRVYRGTKSSVGRFVLFDRGIKNALYLKEKKEASTRASADVEFSLPRAPF